MHPVVLKNGVKAWTYTNNSAIILLYRKFIGTGTLPLDFKSSNVTPNTHLLKGKEISRQKLTSVPRKLLAELLI